MFSHVSVHPSIHPFIHPPFCLSTGVTPTRSSWDWGGYPSQVQPGTPHQTWLEVPCQGGVPHLRYPPIRPGRGISLLEGTLPGGTPPQVPPCQAWPGGGNPPQETDGVFYTPQSVCLLRSCRRTFLYSKSFLKTAHFFSLQKCKYFR